MFIICENDFPFMVCPFGINSILANKIAMYFQEKCGCQLGLSSPTRYFVQEAEFVPKNLIEQLESGIKNDKV